MGYLRFRVHLNLYAVPVARSETDIVINGYYNYRVLDEFKLRLDYGVTLGCSPYSL